MIRQRRHLNKLRKSLRLLQYILQESFCVTENCFVLCRINMRESAEKDIQNKLRKSLRLLQYILQESFQNHML